MNPFTPGPWFRDSEGRIWRRDPSELYENGGGVAGDKPLATVHKGWHGEDQLGFPVAGNARLIAAAPELLAALEDANAETKLYDGHPGKWGHVIAKALGEA